jgi:diacylglycerol kinase (ATP)
MRSSILIYNPAARNFSPSKIARARAFLESKGVSVKTVETQGPLRAISLAEEALRSSPDLVIAAGGDGTYNEVMNGIAGSEIPLAILPLGTTNVLAKELGIPEHVEEALEIAITGVPKAVCLGRITFPPPRAHSRLFCLMAGFGFDGDVVREVDRKAKRYGGRIGYVLSGVRTWLKFDPPRLTVKINGRSYEASSAVIGKASKYGGNFYVTPGASLVDPFLHICLFQGRHRTDIVRYVAGVLAKRHTGFRDVKYVKAESAEIYGQSHIQIDGDYVGMGDARLDVMRDALRLIF